MACALALCESEYANDSRCVLLVIIAKLMTIKALINHDDNKSWCGFTGDDTHIYVDDDILINSKQEGQHCDNDDDKCDYYNNKYNANYEDDADDDDGYGLRKQSDQKEENCSRWSVTEWVRWPAFTAASAERCLRTELIRRRWWWRDLEVWLMKFSKDTVCCRVDPFIPLCLISSDAKKRIRGNRQYSLLSSFRGERRGFWQSQRVGLWYRQVESCRGKRSLFVVFCWQYDLQTTLSNLCSAAGYCVQRGGQCWIIYEYVLILLTGSPRHDSLFRRPFVSHRSARKRHLAAICTYNCRQQVTNVTASRSLLLIIIAKRCLKQS